MDTVLAIVGLALGLASLVPAFTSTGQRRKIIFVAVGVSLVGIFAFQLYEVFLQQSRIDSLKNELVDRLVASRAMTFEQMLSDLYYPDFSALNDALDALVEEGKVQHEVLEVQSNAGARYKVRVYYVVPYANR